MSRTSGHNREQFLRDLRALELEVERRERQARIPAVFQPLLRSHINGHRVLYKGAHGGRGSGKSHFFAELLVSRCAKQDNVRAVCVREIQHTLEQSVKRLLEDKILEARLSSKFRVMNTHIETTKGIIIFQGMRNHTAQSIKSLEGFDIAFVEEAQTLSQRSLDLLIPTLRKEGSEIWFGWNPRKKTDPVDKFLRGDEIPPQAVVVESNYKDNPYFPDNLRLKMEWDKSHDPEKYAHVWLGGYERHAESRVFRNFRVEAFETPDDAPRYLGGDWGFSVDPTVLVSMWIKGKTLYIDHEAYKVGCEIDATPALFDSLYCGCLPGFPCKNEKYHAMARRWLITADSARPETISYLRRHGYPRINPAVKGPNSVKEGVIFLQGYDIVIHPRCTHTIDEYTLYSFKTDPLTGVVIPILEDKKNHVIDSCRYGVEPIRHPGPRQREAQWG